MAAGDAEELAALRRLAELEARSGTAPVPPAPSPIDKYAHNAEWTATEMPLWKQIAAGAGKTMVDVGQGIKQRLGIGQTLQEVDANRERDVQLMATPGGFSGSILGGAALTAPSVAIPGANTVAGSAVLGGLYGAAQPTGTGESAFNNAALGAATAGGLNYGMSKAGGFLADKLGAREAAAAPGNARAAQLAKVLQEGRDLGLTVPPSQANPSVLNRVLESIGGKAATQQAASATNQDIVYAAGQRHAGLQPNQAITEEALAEARKAAAEPYRQVARLFDDGPQTPATEFLQKKASDALEKWKTSNALANRWFTYAGTSKLPPALDKAKAFQASAENALDTLESIAASTPRGASLVPDLKAARVQIAKIHSVDDAMRGSSFNAQALAKALEKGAPLSGDLRTIGQFALDYPKAVAPPQQGGSVGVNQLLPFIGAGGGGAIGGALGAPGIGGMLGFAASQAAPPVTRSLILSPTYQRLLANPAQQTPGLGSQMANALMNNPYMRALLPMGGAMAAAGAQQ